MMTTIRRLREEKILTKTIFDEIESYLGGVPSFFKAMAFDPSLLSSAWNAYKRILFQDGAIPQQTKYVMLYLVVKAHSGYQSCLNMHENMMRRIGVRSEIIEQVKEDLERASLDRKTKDILVFSYHGTDKNRVDERFKKAFRQLLTDEEMTEAVLVVNTCKGLQDFIHTLDLPH